MDVICVLPARLRSTRISRKLLLRIAGRPLIEWAWRAASRVSGFDRIIIATDSEEIRRCARGFDAEVMLTREDHSTGTDRVEEAATRLGASEDDIVVTFQADEPFVDAPTVEAAVRALDRGGSGPDVSTPDVSTLAAPIQREEEWMSPGVVKVARADSGTALYFSRSPIPHSPDCVPGFGGEARTDGGRDGVFLRHIGIYACRRPALRRWSGLPESRLESMEKLEQLRALEAGMHIHVEVGPPTEPGIDLPADIERAERILATANY